MGREPDRQVDRWVRACGLAAIAASLPTVVWRLLVGAGATLGTPRSWRESEGLPGAGTGYVVTLSAVQLAAALLTVVLFVPDADRVPRWSPVGAGRRVPAGLVVAVSLVGALLLAVLCVASAVSWDRVDPFRDVAVASGWSRLCSACYALALAWPALLVATTVGYRRSRRRARRAARV